YQPLLPGETFDDVLKFLDRDTLDSAMLVCRFMFNAVGTPEVDHLAVRLVAEVSLGEARK
ncbi:hypothetical protein AAVH_19383, partial [Aphelenchoides avenae]